ncbi:b3 domain-containing transcription factor vrn1 [Quercus suber]|uniref:B3 domain-containing transcription factor vrn1 n=1 Tax=Quercus suber TaxID=58331 RepID=A0AAW0L6T6_QUESU
MQVSYGRQEALRVAEDHRVERWTHSRESPTPGAILHSIPFRQNLFPFYSYLENEVASNCTLTLENVTLDRVQQCEAVKHELFRDALCIHVSVDGYFWSRFNSAELSTVATLIAPYPHFWQVGLKKANNNIWFCNGWQDFQYEGNSRFHVLIFDKTTTEIQYPPRKNCKLEDHQAIQTHHKQTSMYRPIKHEVREKYVLKTLSSMSIGREREQLKQLKSSSLKILLSWVSRGRIIW